MIRDSMIKACMGGLVSLGILASSSKASAQTLDANEAVELLDGALQAIWSFDVQVQVVRRIFLDSELSGKGRQATLVKRGKRASPFVDRHHYRQVFQRGKGRIEFLDGPGGKPGQVIVYDREVEKTWNPREASSLVRQPAGRIVGEGEDYFEAFRTAYGRLSLLKCLRERRNVVVKDGGPGKFTLEAGPVAPGGNIDLPRWGFRVTLGTDRGFMPVVLERFEEIKGRPFVVRRTTVTEAKKIDGGVWVPIIVTTQSFDFIDKGTFGEIYDEVVLTVDVSRSSWNRELPEETFQLPIPAGTRVTDAFRQAQYVTGNPDPGKNLKDLAHDAKDLVPVVVAAPPAKASATWPLWLILGTAAVLLAAIAILYVRRRKKGEQPAS